LKKLNSIKHSRKIICISENTKMDLMDYYPFIKESQISVIYFGVNRSIFNDEFSGRKKNQIVYVGQRSGYKNFHVLLEAFKRSKKLRQELKLIVFGGGPFSRLENEFINSNGLSSFVENIQGNDEKLINLYRESIAMVYTSIYEGFGSPVLESMASGCVVLANNTPALKEAGGSCAIYFNTRDVESLVFELENLFSTTEKIEELRKLGIERAKSFTWEKTAQLTKMVYEEILN
jgi:glycosyltransferase involved in cell wall biosynthesis